MTRSRRLGSVLRTLTVLDTLAAAGPLGASDIANRLDVHRSSVFQQLQTLAEAGWVEQLPTSAYRLTLKPFSFARAALDHAGLGQRLDPWIEELAMVSVETASVAALQGRRAIVISRREPSVAMKVNIDVGSSLSLATSASGRILTAMLDAEALATIRDSGIATASDEQLTSYRTQGWSDQQDELVGGMSSVAIALETSTGDRIALSLAGPTGRLEHDDALQMLRTAAQHAPAGVTVAARREQPEPPDKQP